METLLKCTKYCVFWKMRIKFEQRLKPLQFFNNLFASWPRYMKNITSIVDPGTQPKYFSLKVQHLKTKFDHVLLVSLSLFVNLH